MLAVAAAYANTFTAPFVYDDLEAITGNASIRRLWPLSDVLLPNVPGGLTVSGRPLVNLSLAVNYAISGDAVWSYHALNIAIHMAAALVLFGFVRRLLAQTKKGTPAGAHDSLAMAIAALWALHPLQTQAVTYTVQRAESLMGLFYLLTLYAFVRAAESHDAPRRWQILSVTVCALGMAAKEVMATAPLLVLLCDRTFFTGTFRAAWRERRGYYLALGSTWLLLGALIWSTGGNRGGTVGLGVGQPLWAYPLTQFQAIAHYLRLSLWPQPLVFEYGTFWVERTGDIAPYAIIVLPLLGLTLWALWCRPIYGFFGAWFFAILAPTSLAPGTIQMIVEHRMYLPLAAVVSAFVLALDQFSRRWAVAGGLSMALVSVGLTAARNHDYRSNLALWSGTVAARPANPRAHEGLAEALLAAGRVDEAIMHHREAVRLLPDEAHYHYNLAHALARAERYEEACQSYRVALRLAPNEAKTHNNLAIALGRIDQGEAALPHYAEAERLAPTEAQYTYNHGVALVRLHREQEAISRYETALRLRPDYADAQFNLGSALATLGRFEAALPHYREALRLRPADLEYRITYAGALHISGDSVGALAEYQRALRADPAQASAHYGLGNALAALRRHTEAIASYETALRLRPDYADAHFKLGNALIAADRITDALAHYEAAVRLHPNDAEAHHNLGIAYARLDRFAEAGRAFESALRLRPDYPEAQRHLAQVRALLGH